MRASAALLSLLVCAAFPIGAQESAADSNARACDDQAFRQFDFWIGEWDVTNAAGKLAGRNTITSAEQGCVLIEQWRAASGGTGMSMNHYDPVSRRWKQHWVGLGLILEMSGGVEGRSMVLEGPLHYVAQKRTTRLRGVWTPLADGRVRQQFLESTDDGRTWTEWFDGYYRRRR